MKDPVQLLLHKIAVGLVTDAINFLENDYRYDDESYEANKRLGLQALELLGLDPSKSEEEIRAQIKEDREELKDLE